MVKLYKLVVPDHYPYLKQVTLEEEKKGGAVFLNDTSVVRWWSQVMMAEARWSETDPSWGNFVRQPPRMVWLEPEVQSYVVLVVGDITINTKPRTTTTTKTKCKTKIKVLQSQR